MKIADFHSGSTILSVDQIQYRTPFGEEAERLKQHYRVKQLPTVILTTDAHFMALDREHLEAAASKQSGLDYILNTIGYKMHGKFSKGRIAQSLFNVKQLLMRPGEDPASITLRTGP